MNNLVQNNPRFFKALLFIFIIGGLQSCCRSSYNCPPGFITHLPYEQLNVSDTLSFITETGKFEKFIVKEKYRSSGYSGECKNSGMYCFCDPCDTKTEILLENSNPNSSLLDYTIRVYSEGDKFAEGYTSIPRTTIQFSSDYFSFAKYYNDSTNNFIPNYTLNNTVYDSLVVIEKDTLYANQVKKVYYSVSKGVVSFKTINPNETYYLQE